ncbi:FABP family protein [Enemella sp. A6]|uniref:FABP family protein n=1 Tax=Enemella sp. A6 TaxID=3440152 RepID=UPI003EB81755
MDVHPALSVLAGLIGTWEGDGSGSYPTIDDFTYRERVTFTTDGRPFITYRQTTTSPDGKPMHHETGYLRGVGENDIEWVIVQPSGVVEVSPGDVRVNPNEIQVHSTSTMVGLTPTAKHVEAVQRCFILNEEADCLSYDLAMAAVGEEMTHHLSAALHRVTDDDTE